MAWIPTTSAEREALRAQILTGATVVQYGDRRIQYGSPEEMVKLWTWLELMETAAAVAVGGAGPQRRSYVTFSRR